MTNNLIAVVLFAFMCAFSVSELSAQIKEEKHKVIIVEKEIAPDGTVTEKRIVKEGDEAKAYMAQEEVKTNDQKVKIRIIEEEDGKAASKREEKYRIKTKDGDGKVKVLEWDGQGEMPEEMQKILEEQDIDITAIKDKEIKTIKKEAYEIKTEDGEGNIKVLKCDGKGDMPEEMKKIMEEEGLTEEIGGEIKTSKVIVKQNFGNQENVMNLQFDSDEIPEEVKKILEEQGIQLHQTTNENGEIELQVISTEKESEPKKKAQLGVNIDNHSQGVLILDVVPETSAAIAGIQKGDIITTVNESNMTNTQALIDIIADKKVGEVIEVDLMRGEEMISKSITLRERIDRFPLKTWDDVMAPKKREVEIEVEIER